MNDSAHASATQEEPKPVGGVGGRAARAAAGLLAMQVAARLLTVVSLLIYARVQGSRDTGVIGICLTVLATLDVFSQFGIRKSLIQYPGEVTRFYPTAFTVECLRGLGIGLAVYLLSEPLSRWFQEPAVVPLLQVFCLVPIFRGAANISFVGLERELSFRRILVLEIVGPVLDFAVTLGCLYAGAGVYAIAYGKITSAAWFMLGSYLILRVDWRPGFSWPHFLELNTFGRWVLAAGIVTLLVTRGSDFVIGRLLPTSAFGLYTLAVFLAVTPLTEFNNIVSRVTFPAYSRLQHEPERLR